MVIKYSSKDKTASIKWKDKNYRGYQIWEVKIENGIIWVGNNTNYTKWNEWDKVNLNKSLLNNAFNTMLEKQAILAEMYNWYNKKSNEK